MILLLLNHQNLKQWPYGAILLTISPFLVIDDNTIKTSMNLKELTNWTTFTCLDFQYRFGPLNPLLPIGFSPYLLFFFLMLTWSIWHFSSFGKHCSPFGRYLLLIHIFVALMQTSPPFGIKSPKNALQNNVAQGKKS